jgi:hypothetical protein
MLMQAASQVGSLATQVAAAPASGSPLSSLKGPAGDSAAVNALSAASANTVASLNSIVTLLGCQSIDAILSTLFTGFCTNGIATVIGIARILIAASVFLFLQLGVGIDMCCFHPGYASRYLSEAELAEIAAAKGMAPVDPTATGGAKAVIVGAEGAFAGSNPQAGRGASVV